MAELKITLKRSIIGRPQNQRDTANDAIKGMVNTVSHLVDVEEV